MAEMIKNEKECFVTHVVSSELGLKSNSPEGPSEIEKMWHKVGKTDPLIFRPEITYSMPRIVV